MHFNRGIAFHDHGLLVLSFVKCRLSLQLADLQWILVMLLSIMTFLEQFFHGLPFLLLSASCPLPFPQAKHSAEKKFLWINDK